MANETAISGLTVQSFQKNLTSITPKEELSKILSAGNIISNVMYVASKTSSFIDREWLLSIVKEKLDNRYNNFLWISGASGVGKTAFASSLFKKLNGYRGGIYYCRYDENRTRYAISVIKGLAFYLNSVILGYAEKVKSLISIESLDETSENKLFEVLLYTPLNQISIDMEVMLIIDALDEMIEGEAEKLLHLLMNNPMPNTIKLIFTSRPEVTIRNLLGGALEISLDRRNFAVKCRGDLKQYLNKALSSSDIIISEDDIEKILDKSDNNFLYVHWVVQEILSGGTIEIGKLPTGLNALYLYNIKRKYADNNDGINEYINDAKPILELLSATKSSISMKDMSDFLGIALNILNIRMRKLSSFIVEAEQNGEKRIYHRSFIDWLENENNIYFIDNSNGENCILDYILVDPYHLRTNDYLRKWGLAHIVDQIRADILQSVLDLNDVEMNEIIEYELFYAYVNSQEKVLSLLRGVNNDQLRRILITTFRKAMSYGRNDLLNKIVDLLKEKQEFIRAKMLEGEKYQYDQEYDLALKRFTECLTMANYDYNKENSLWTKRYIGLCYNRLGSLKRDMGLVQEAKEYYLMSNEIFQYIYGQIELKSSTEHWYEYCRDYALTNVRLGEIEFKEDNIDEAKKYFETYHSICEQLLKKRESLEIKRRLSISLLRLGDIDMKLCCYSNAYKLYNAALKRFIEILSKRNEDNIISDYLVYADDSTLEVINQEHHKTYISDFPKESRELDPLHDLSICYVRLGDAALFAGNLPTTKKWYNAYLNLCKYMYDLRKTNESQKDYERAIRRKEVLDND